MNALGFFKGNIRTNNNNKSNIGGEWEEFFLIVENLLNLWKYC